MAVMLMHVAKFLPLVRSEDAADGEGHLRVGLFEASVRSGDAVNGGKDSAFVWIVGLKQGVELELFLLQSSVDVDELHAAILKDLLDLLNLCTAQTDGLDNLGVFPPTTGGNYSMHLFAGATTLEPAGPIMFS